ncbi:hypothetical protein C8J56DRAFT_790676 [Mycena floridula]|nr:hypothetical protein C8J56DRAFT_806901 [Mycena floridula]KAJ7583538.1 hypothetical protein C8J56DRAFT_790676 [Mycena floridula]
MFYPATGLAFSWSQLSGTSVTLNNSHTANASFTAPAVVAVTPLIFALNTTNSAGSSIDQVTVTINPTTIDQITFQQVTWKSGKGSGTLTVLASSNIASSSLFVSASTPDIAKTAMTSLGGGRWQALITIKPAPALVTVTSSLGASASSTVGKG